MATVHLSIKDNQDGVGVAYELKMDPVPKNQDELTLAHKIGLTTFDAIESILKKFGAEIQHGGDNAQTQGR